MCKQLKTTWNKLKSYWKIVVVLCLAFSAFVLLLAFAYNVRSHYETYIAGDGIFAIEPLHQIGEEFYLATGDRIRGNITAQGVGVDFYMTNSSGFILLSHNYTLSHGFDFANHQRNGTFTLHVVNSHQTEAANVVLKYTTQNADTGLGEMRAELLNIPVDTGGLYSLLGTAMLAVVLFAIIIYKLRNNEAETNPKDNGNQVKRTVKAKKEAPTIDNLAYISVAAILLGGLALGLWLGLRKVALLITHYLVIGGYAYNQYEVLDVVSYGLTINLCLTLLLSLPIFHQEKERINSIVDASLQAVLIGIITLLPKYADPNLIRIIGTQGWVLVLFGMAVMIGALVFVRRSIRGSTHPSYAS